METKTAAQNQTKGKGPAPEIKTNPKVHATMPAPEVKVVDKPAAKEAKPKASKAGTKYVLLKETDKDTKMPLQCRQIIGILAAAPEKTLNREDLLAKMTALPIVTRQPMERILGFYQSRLVSGNWVRIEPVVKVEKPAATAKTKTAETKTAETKTAETMAAAAEKK